MRTFFSILIAKQKHHAFVYRQGFGCSAQTIAQAGIELIFTRQFHKNDLSYVSFEPLSSSFVHTLQGCRGTDCATLCTGSQPKTRCRSGYQKKTHGGLGDQKRKCLYSPCNFIDLLPAAGFLSKSWIRCKCEDAVVQHWGQHRNRLERKRSAYRNETSAVHISKNSVLQRGHIVSEPR